MSWGEERELGGTRLSSSFASSFLAGWDGRRVGRSIGKLEWEEGRKGGGGMFA